MFAGSSPIAPDPRDRIDACGRFADGFTAQSLSRRSIDIPRVEQR
jgi:hypothetical protein